MNKAKKLSGVVYSTDPDFVYSYENSPQASGSKQQLRIRLESKDRSGKVVTLISGFIGTSEQADVLARKLKQRCGVGGSVREGTIMLQGDHRKKATELLSALGFGVTH
jgi:translation initiation factor 1